MVPRRVLTPNERYAALVAVAGYVPVPLTGDEYLELMPLDWRVINDYGVQRDYRTYDCEELNPYRRQPSGVPGKATRWEVHYDPYKHQLRVGPQPPYRRVDHRAVDLPADGW
jgi:putative transposase